MRLRMVLAERGGSSIPPRPQSPRIRAALGEDGAAIEPRLASSLVRFLDIFDFYDRALDRDKEASGLPR